MFIFAALNVSIFTLVTEPSCKSSVAVGASPTLKVFVSASDSTPKELRAVMLAI